MLTLFRRLMKNEDGATAIEYALLASVIAVALVAGARAFGASLVGAFGRMTAAVALF